MKSARSARKSAPNAPKKTARPWNTPTPKRRRRRIWPLMRLRARLRAATRKSSCRSLTVGEGIYPESARASGNGRLFFLNDVVEGGCSPTSLDLLSRRPGCRPNEPRLVVQHRQPQLIGSGGQVHINRHHHAFVENLLIGGSVEHAIHLKAARPQILAVCV